MKKKQLILSIFFTCATGQAPAALIFHYDMEETTSPLINQSGGEEAIAVGSGHQYGIPGPAGWGNAVGLNDNGSWQLSPTDSVKLDLANNFTVAGWIYIDSAIVKTGLNTNNHRLIGDDAAWDRDGWAFGVTDGIMRFTRNGITDANDPSAAPVPTDEWVHIAATPTSSGINFYLNGLLTGTNPNGSNNFTGLGNNGVRDPFAIGRSYGDGEAQWFAGALDEIRVYDTVLTQSEIANLATTIPEPSSSLLIALFGLTVALRHRRI